MEAIAVSFQRERTGADFRAELAGRRTERILAELGASPELAGAFLLTTRAQIEVYSLTEDVAQSTRRIRDVVVHECERDEKALPMWCRVDRSAHAVRRLLSRAAGLDPDGDDGAELLAQLALARSGKLLAGERNVFLDRLLGSARTTAKRVGEEVRRGRSTASLAGVIADVVEKIFRDLTKCSVLLVGLGEPGRCAAECLKRKGVSQLTIANRSFGRVAALAQALDARALPLDRSLPAIEGANVVIASTSSPEPVFRVEELRPLLGARAGRPLCLIDLGLAHDFDPEIGRLDGVFLQHHSQLRKLVDRNRTERAAELPKIKAIVEEETSRFLAWQRSLASDRVLAQLRRRFELVRRRELSRHAKRFCRDDRESLEQLTESVVDTLVRGLAEHIHRSRSDSVSKALEIDTIYEAFDLAREETPWNEQSSTWWASLKRAPWRRKAYPAQTAGR